MRSGLCLITSIAITIHSADFESGVLLQLRCSVQTARAVWRTSLLCRPSVGGDRRRGDVRQVLRVQADSLRGICVTRSRNVVVIDAGAQAAHVLEWRH
eukprot:6211332-Pleurochrysis_carterae.AAC.4